MSTLCESTPFLDAPALQRALEQLRLTSVETTLRELSVVELLLLLCLKKLVDNEVLLTCHFTSLRPLGGRACVRRARHFKVYFASRNSHADTVCFQVPPPHSMRLVPHGLLQSDSDRRW